MSDELKACPFCGTDTALEVSNYTEVICTKCFNVPNIKGWNTRPLEDALRSRVEKLENELAEAGKNQSEYHNTVLAQEKEIARLREQVRWIPVEERLPEPDTNVLIFVSDKNVDDSDIQISDYEDRYGWGFLHNEIVTHWMPLPIPPEVNNE